MKKKRLVALLTTLMMSVTMVIPANAQELEVIVVNDSIEDLETVDAESITVDEILTDEITVDETVIEVESMENLDVEVDTEISSEEFYDGGIVSSISMGGNIQCTLYDDGRLVYSGTGKMESPLNSEWYEQYNEQVKKIIIEDGIESLSKWSCSGFANLTKIIVPASVKDIYEHGVFGYNPKIKSIGPTGSGCDIEYGWTDKIPDNAFYNCGTLDNVIIAESIKEIGSWAFNNCEINHAVIYPIELKYLHEISGHMKNIKSAGVIGSGCDVEYNWVREVPENALKDCDSLEKVVIPNNIASIGIGAFSGCKNLKEFNMPTGIRTIGAGAFKDCTNITSFKNLVLPSTLAVVGDGAFSGCTNMETVEFKEGTTTLNGSTFLNCKNLKVATIPSSVTIIGWTCFEGTNVTIYGYSGSVAEVHANVRNIPFKAIGSFNQDTNNVTNKFVDIDANAWYIPAIQYSIDNKIMSGTSTNTFAPNTPCTRTMMVTILWSCAGKGSANISNPFNDVKESDWFYDSVLWGVKNGITSGVSADMFGKTDVTREQVALFLQNYARVDRRHYAQRADISSYADASSVSPWAKEAMQWAVYWKIISGKTTTTLDPKGKATRAEVAQMIMSYQKNVEKMLF